MKNNLADLNNHLFAMLEEVEDDDQIKDQKEFDKLIKKAKTVCSISSQILRVASVQVAAIRTAENCGLLNKDMPALLTIKDSVSETSSKQKLLGGK